MRHAPTLLFLFLSLLATAVYGEIYRSTDDQGQAVFSDAPKPGSTPVELAPTNTTPAVSPSTQPHSFPKVLGPAPNTLNIQQPGNGQVLPQRLLCRGMQQECGELLNPACVDAVAVIIVLLPLTL